MAETEKTTASSKMTSFLEKNRKGFIAGLAVIIVALIAFVIVDSCNKSAAKKGLAQVDEITYTLTKDSIGLADSEIESRRTAAFESLAPLAKKGGIVGVRANILLAELEYQQNNYENALNYWKDVAAKGKKSYTAPLAYYNIASCYEALNNLNDAEVYYKKAADFKDFVLKLHAQFSYGRVLEANGKYTDAVAVYKDMEASNPDDDWTKLAKTRIIKLQMEGKVE